jgi:crossover junction endodeoxyribonuclease RusA
MKIEFPWPSNKLSPNARLHWSERSRVVKSTRQSAAWFTRAVVRPGTFVPAMPVSVVTTFYPPDKQPRDEDNLKARCKAIYDGIADAIGVDDRHFRHQRAVFGDPIKGGKVVVEIEAADTWEQLGDVVNRVLASIPTPKRDAA